MTLRRAGICALLVTGVGACAGNATPERLDERVQEINGCRALFAEMDERVAGANVSDAQFARIEGFAYLRIDRLLADVRVKPGPEDARFAAWVDALRGRDADARAVELANLPAADRAALGRDLRDRLDTCAHVLMGEDLDQVSDRQRLLSVARVPEDYSVAKRVFGLYPFTSLPFNAGVEDLHESMRADFALPLESLPIEGRLTRYVPAPVAVTDTAASIAALLVAARRDANGLPILGHDELNRLFDTFAPIYEIDVVTDDDRIGMPYWPAEGLPSVDTRRPVMFRRIAHGRVDGRILLQLVYSVWFPARPPEGDFDLLSGRLDGITFRVTLADDGRPILYDSMHNCGCYHLFLPTTRLALKPASGAHEEPPLVAQWMEPRVERPVLRIATRTHYLQRVYFDPTPGDGTVYRTLDDDALRSLALLGGGRRSLFDTDGIVAGSERGERWLFWPMGIAEPGAMRQWGRHATAFVGTRHFDDPDLIERYFVIAE